MSDSASNWKVFSGLLNNIPRRADDQVDYPADMLMFNKPFIPADTQLNFEKRVLTPSQYPVLPQEDGSIATHKMAWSDLDDGFMAYPTVVQGKDGKLAELDGRQAYEYALANKEFRKFPTAQEAEDYARGGYKKQWGAGEKRDPQQDMLAALAALGQRSPQ